MAFTLSGAAVTQSGTDTSLAGLAAIAGITRTLHGTQAVFNMADRQLIVTGTLTMDPEIEEMHFNQSVAVLGSVTVNNNGVFTIGREIDVGAATNRFSFGTAIRFSRNNDNNFSENNTDLRVNSGGTLHWYGGAIYTRRIVAFMEGSNIFTYSPNAALIGQHTAEFQLRQRAANANIDGLTTRGMFVAFITAPTKWDRWTPFDTATFALSFSSSTGSNIFIPLRGFDPSGVSGQQMAVWANKWCRLVNCGPGSNVVFGGNNATSSGTNTGLYEIRQEVNLTYRDLAGANVNPKFWMTDFDNGSRLAPNLIGANPTYLPSRVYSGTAVAGAANLTTDGGVLTAVLWRNVGGIGMNASNRYDYRCAAGNSSDVFTFRACEYTRLLDQADVVLKGVVAVAANRVMFLDRVLTQTDKAVVDAYTQIETPQKLYDRAKSHLFDIFAGQADTLVSRSGNLIDAGAFNIVIDASATPAFALVGNTITIRAANFAGDLVTTGTITFLNGATTSGTYTDTNGTVSPPSQLTVRINQPGCDVFILAAGTDSVLASVDAQAGTDFVYQFTTLSSVDIGVIRPGFVPLYVRNYALQSGVSLLPISISVDRNYV